MKPKVLVADDLPDVQDMVKENLSVLSSDGIEVLQALDIISAKRLFKENPDIRVIVMDYYMPLRADDPEKRMSNSNTLEFIHERGDFLAKNVENFEHDSRFPRQVVAYCCDRVERVREVLNESIFFGSC